MPTKLKTISRRFNMNENLVILSCIGFLGLKKPVEIRMFSDNKARGDCAAFYEARYRKGRIIKHVLFLNIPEIASSGFHTYSVIAHELCHAAQFEYGVFNKKYHHDEKFQGMCNLLEKQFKEMGYPLQKLYSPETDTE